MHAPRDVETASDVPGAPGFETPGPRRFRNFSVRYRHSALSAGQRQTWERLWPELGADVVPPDGTGGSARLDGGEPKLGPPHQPDRTDPLDTQRWFGRDAPVVLEIGCGAGTSTVAMAQAEPDLDVIAVEVYERGLAQLLCAIEREHLGNIRLLRGDGLEVLEHLIAPESLIGVRVFFPDPWPKARHHKRRLLQPATMALIADRLKPGGVLHAATDHADYAVQIAESGDGEPRLRRVTDAPTRTGLPISIARPTTKYEAKGRDAGSVINEFVWERI
ncbi:tRNA (guanosine(46)-N7)-methyltransferase TrmB [Mycolicibacter longobardus]|uniref:tRNA (guanine-N(7)-)-methyltransferase n=1 Tax=Mycolicibacter longobardus TaxID=1108812 RepID=A0A1X1Y648_9MYCO|nr:tRNA (guanosine(46)-N7)-methyltransferase TrmB [Mycolicibacter longobardus]MCV7382925.1 tRNA (guanosine(46)-N7)-methyltransferase TrmB [Mycolicibacter longobardus]ORW06494.1 tRNA (guanine-N7)-methyltransferase [Mycolicibacter longobardus]